MLNDKLTLLIVTCDKYSDLWEPHILLLNRNWSDRNIDTLLVTDHCTQRTFDQVRVISAGENAEFTQRLTVALENIATEYVMVVLDDYFPIYPVSSERIENLVDTMNTEHLDYIRLFCDPNSFIRICGHEKLYHIRLDRNYDVNLHQGIWRKTFILATISEPLNAWQYEVSLTKIALEVNAKCVLSKGKEYESLDILRKGKITRRANRYFKRYPIYIGKRQNTHILDDLMIATMGWLKRLLPRKLAYILKQLGVKLGYTFYSD